MDSPKDNSQLAKGDFPYYPLLFACFPILYFYQGNTNFQCLEVVIVPLLVSVCLTGSLFFVLWLLTKTKELAAVMTAIMVFFFFSYAYSSSVVAVWLANLSFLSGGLIRVSMGSWFSVLWLLLLLVCLIAPFQWRKQVQGKEAILNMAALCCLLISVLNIGFKEIARSHLADNSRFVVVHDIEDAQLSGSDRRPDIYYIILDGCARTDILRQVFRYDNSPFIHFLENKGFYVAKNSHSNYQTTVLSMASSLNMSYLNKNFLPQNSGDWIPMIRLIENNSTVKQLKKIGYKYVLVSSTCAMTRSSPLADEIISLGWDNDFQNWLLYTTYFRPLDEHWHFLRDAGRRRWLNTFQKAGFLPDSDVPKFVFLHLLLPHPPYLFEADGNPPRRGSILCNMEDFANRHAYSEQVKFTERQVEALIDKLLSKKQKPIIILQSDHGTACTPYYEGFEKPSNFFLKERMSILNAYYFPGVDSAGFSQSVTPVNTFRLLLNKYFKGHLKLVEDKLFFSDYSKAYDFIDVTEKIGN